MTTREPTPIEQIPFLEGEFTSESFGMISGLAEQQKYTYHVYKDFTRSDYRWLVADVANRGDHVYCGTIIGSQREQGFGGRTMDFLRENGETITLHGPWHSNSQALLNKTKVDVTQMHLTIGCIALYCDHKALEFPQARYTHLIHVDRELVLGAFSRIPNLAEELTHRYGRPLYYYSKSTGGSRAGRTTLPIEK